MRPYWVLYVHSTVTTGMSMNEKMSFGLRTTERTPTSTMARAITGNV